MRLVIWYLRRLYKKTGKPILFLKGTGKDYPMYILYTEDEHAYDRMDNF